MMSILNSPQTPKRYLYISLLALLLLPLLSQPSRADSYDADFDRFGRRFLPYIQKADIWLAAQAWQESSLDPYAVSPAQAKGLMQTMDATHAEIGRALGIQCSQFNPRCSIMFGAYYDDRMTRNFLGKRDRQPEDALLIGLAAYNCGLGCVLKAQERCFDARLICGINPCLPAESVEYTKRIRNRFIELKSNPQ